MLNKSVGIVVWRGKAYFPAPGRFPSGIYADIEPVYVAELELGDLIAAAEKIIALGISQLPEVTVEEWRKRSDPILKATQASSWKELARTGASYGIGWTDQRVRVDMSYRDKQGRWQNDPAKVRIFPPDTPLADVIAVVLADIRTRPEVLAPPASE
jgi:hypothetical protein